MAKKKGKPQPQKKFSEKEYIRTRMRSLPVGKCYMADDINDGGESPVLVTRLHPSGTVSLGAFLVDKFCCGVKDTYYQFSISTDELDEIVGAFDERVGLKEIPYEYAHNMVYGAADYAERIGIEPHRDFATTQFILAAKSDVPHIDIEFGKAGRPTLVSFSKLEIDKYERQMQKVLAPDQYDVIYLDPETQDGYYDDEPEYIDEE